MVVLCEETKVAQTGARHLDAPSSSHPSQDLSACLAGYKVSSVPSDMLVSLPLSTQVVSLVLLRWRIDTLSIL